MPNNASEQDDLSPEERLLRESCEEYGVPFELVLRLRDIEEQYSHLKRRHGLPQQMRDLIKEASEKEGR